MKRVTFCLACGATASDKAERCPACDAPLRHDRKKKKTRRRIHLPSTVVLLCVLAGIAVLVALVTAIVTSL